MLTDRKFLMLKPDEIKLSKNRIRINIDELELRLLSNSIAANGITQPLTVRKNDDGEYVLISGERRLRACALAGIRRIPCIVQKSDDLSAYLCSLNENMQRKKLHFIEEAMAIEKLIRAFGMNQTEAAVKLGISNSELSNKLKLLRLETKVLEIIYNSNLTEEHIRPLLKLLPEMQTNALEYIICEGLSVKQTEKYIEELINPKLKEKEKMPVRKFAVGDERLFSNSLNKLCETLKQGGVDLHLSQTENALYSEYKISIRKELPEIKAEQLKIC